MPPRKAPSARTNSEDEQQTAQCRTSGRTSGLKGDVLVKKAAAAKADKNMAQSPSDSSDADGEDADVQARITTVAGPSSQAKRGPGRPTKASSQQSDPPAANATRGAASSKSKAAAVPAAPPLRTSARNGAARAPPPPEVHFDGSESASDSGDSGSGSDTEDHGARTREKPAPPPPQAAKGPKGKAATAAAATSNGAGPSRAPVALPAKISVVSIDQSSSDGSSSSGDDSDRAGPSAAPPPPRRGGRTASGTSGGTGGPTHTVNRPHKGQRSSGTAAAGRAAAAAAAAEAAAAEEALDLDALAEVDLKQVYRELQKAGWKRNASRKRARTETLVAEQQGWRQEMREGFSLLLHGFGSKRTLLNNFSRTLLAATPGGGGPVASGGHGVYTFNGWNPALTARHIVLTAAKALLGGEFKNIATRDVLAQLSALPSERHLFLVLHNIDGPGLRGAADQAALSLLAACPPIHLAASIDHVNAPLLWDQQMLGRFRWLWHDATTFEPYTAETLDVAPALAGCARQSSRRSTGAVLRSLPANAREVFRVLAERQLEDGDTFPGLAYGDLYNLCRRRFIVASDAALRGHLKEFADHELMASRFGEEGDELLYVPHAPDALRMALEAMDAELAA